MDGLTFIASYIGSDKKTSLIKKKKKTAFKSKRREKLSLDTIPKRKSDRRVLVVLKKLSELNEYPPRGEYSRDGRAKCAFHSLLKPRQTLLLKYIRLRFAFAHGKYSICTFVKPNGLLR